MRLALGLVAFVAVAALLPLAVAQDEDQPAKCDRKHVQTGLWCESCQMVLDEDTTLEGKYCKDCCSDLPKEEREEAKKVKICVKTYYRCEDCYGTSWKPGKCEECGTSMEKVVDRCRVIFRCEGCGMEGEKAGPCAEEECKAEKKMFVETCEMSGEFPHVPEK